MAVAITRTEMSARELRAAATKTADAKAARRMLALALVLEGADRKTAADTCGMDRQTLRDWVHRYNAEGLEGLSNRRSAGPSPLLSVEQKAELAQMVREGPELGADGVVRWRRIDLQRRIESRFGVVMHERTVGKQLAGLGFRRLSVRRSAGKRPTGAFPDPPHHPKSDAQAQEAFKKTSPPRQTMPCRTTPGTSRWKSGSKSELDQETVRGTVSPANARVGQQGTLTRIWADRGSRPRAPRDTRYKWAYTKVH